ncbi:hypothetical protein CYR75_11995 [Paracoccus jeotgali]|uniref:Flagellar hook-length control protein-like C-terminal domain-containing protein n=2 Tax=Paracoccus jeotgali TaxID=2065379 RepID=A0A2K9MH23_9RHOB|nr:hypothetical protein CYR75_11995 [Paracoccus jeotgali]
MAAWKTAAPVDGLGSGAFLAVLAGVAAVPCGDAEAAAPATGEGLGEVGEAEEAVELAPPAEPDGAGGVEGEVEPLLAWAPMSPGVQPGRREAGAAGLSGGGAGLLAADGSVGRERAASLSDADGRRTEDASRIALSNDRIVLTERRNEIDERVGQEALDAAPSPARAQDIEHAMAFDEDSTLPVQWEAEKAPLAQTATAPVDRNLEGARDAESPQKPDLETEFATQAPARAKPQTIEAVRGSVPPPASPLGLPAQPPMEATLVAERQLETLASGHDGHEIETPLLWHTRLVGASQSEKIQDTQSDNLIEGLPTAQTSPQKMSRFVASRPHVLDSSFFSALKQAAPFQSGHDTTLLEKSVALGEAGRMSHLIATFTPSPGTAAANTAAPVHQQIASAIVAATPDSPETELLLAPEELGKLRFVFGQDDGALTILITAERPETLQLIRRNADALIQELNQLGLTDATVDFGDRGSRDRDHPAAKGSPSDTDPLAVQQVPAQPADKPPMPLRFGRLELRL